MKNIVRKNQMIITALAIMIAVAGYLNFTGTKFENEDNASAVDEIIPVEDAFQETSASVSEEDETVIADISDEDVIKRKTGIPPENLVITPIEPVE